MIFSKIFHKEIRFKIYKTRKHKKNIATPRFRYVYYYQIAQVYYLNKHYLTKLNVIKIPNVIKSKNVLTKIGLIFL